MMCVSCPKCWAAIRALWPFTFFGVCCVVASLTYSNRVSWSVYGRYIVRRREAASSRSSKLAEVANYYIDNQHVKLPPSSSKKIISSLLYREKNRIFIYPQLVTDDDDCGKNYLVLIVGHSRRLLLRHFRLHSENLFRAYQIKHSLSVAMKKILQFWTMRGAQFYQFAAALVVSFQFSQCCVRLSKPLWLKLLSVINCSTQHSAPARHPSRTTGKQCLLFFIVFRRRIDKSLISYGRTAPTTTSSICGKMT